MENQEFIIENCQVIASLAGNLQGELAAQIRETMLTYIADGYCNFSVDFSKVNDINSTGLGMLVNIQKRALQQGGDIIIHGLQGTVKVAFDRTRLSKAFTILDCKNAVA
ncbi:STAS domain-containing protein [Sporomusa sp.]|jgi:anti-sigma B factor antagonist|uniref:STAS domain-containing protein n=1 Tax=Sporomusa sp. TaxID=2078658 RepID=UPI002B989324|nr:STAS domain-containing protein [Sporomusa sp.]HWR08803.1 STAS domain-containing protein [Sporomusa sp.]